MEVFPLRCTMAGVGATAVVCNKTGLQWENGINVTAASITDNEHEMDDGGENEYENRDESSSSISKTANKIRTRLCPSTVIAAAVGGVQIGGGRLGLAFRSMTAKSRRFLRREYSESNADTEETSISHSYSFSNDDDVSEYANENDSLHNGFGSGDHGDNDCAAASRKRKR